MRRAAQVALAPSFFLCLLLAGCNNNGHLAADAPTLRSVTPPMYLPADFPTDVTLPTPYAVQSVNDMGHLMMATLATERSVPELLEHSAPRMLAQGWLQVANVRHASGNALQVYRKNGRELSLAFAPNRQGSGSGSIVTVQLRDPMRSL